MHVEHQDRELREIENTMMQHTYSDIMSLEPCFDPAERGYCTRDWQGTALDVLRHPNVTAQDKLWKRDRTRQAVARAARGLDSRARVARVRVPVRGTRARAGGHSRPAQR